MIRKIFFPEHGITAEAEQGANLLEIIHEQGLPIEALCNGRGTCGKCKVLVNGRDALACKTEIDEDIEVRILSTAEGQKILTDTAVFDGASDEKSDSGRVGFAIDIGTTTVVIKALDTGSGRELGVRAFTNPQRSFGADVLSRINISLDDASELSALITEALDEAISAILKETCISGEDVDKVVIAANTTMTYLLLNLPCRSLGFAPFKAAYEIEPLYTYGDVFGQKTLSCPVLVYPYISSFVGGDIVSGLVHIKKHFEPSDDSSFMLVDMGTNGEIAFCCRGRMLTTSTAAGPALEGGNISCGMSGTEGAINTVDIGEDGEISFTTIGGAPARGICGSGVIDLIAKLIGAGYIETTGAFSDKASERTVEYSPDPAKDRKMKALVIAEAAAGGERITFTQKDLREFQLAKGAISAGINILIKEMGELPERFYLAGAFGQNIDIESAFAVGLIPGSMRGRIRFAGNTSLGGCIDACLAEGTSLPRLPAQNDSEEINLGGHKDFNDVFMETMMFE